MSLLISLVVDVVSPGELRMVIIDLSTGLAHAVYGPCHVAVATCERCGVSTVDWIDLTDAHRWIRTHAEVCA